ncbi:AtpZ/AtpI family protein [Phenylobacterium sp.]|uniref:AtpZ/AtpI family protein n=1 Tax=Phenylobacterium sp. TaxID=1871053 RepID=UPI002DF6A627|nr:AtpZ/AtpI family protein [Phenylobacterium sp.]
MPKTDDQPEEARKSLDERLGAVEAARARSEGGDAQRAMAQGYRFLGEVVGGVLAGAGFGWLVDRFTGTAPLGLIGGLLIGTGFSIWVAVRSAVRSTTTETTRAGPSPRASDDEDED